MIEIKKTKNGVVGFGTLDGDDIIKALLEALGYNEDEANDECTETSECEETSECLEDTEVVENDHMVSVGYNTEDAIVTINYDESEHPWAVASALLDAAAHMWPKTTDHDKELAKALRELAQMGRELGDAYVEGDQ